MDTGLTFIGDSAAAHSIRQDITSAARSDAKVLITGETGVGKDVIARLIHRESRRQHAPLATLNCAGLPDSLLESELFGHTRGSFTGAYRDKPGILEAASGGTVFLDEVGEMSPRMQGVLLRFLETGEVQRVGADRVHTRTNVRIIAATNRDLHTEIGAGRFRQDLFYRLNVVRIDVPPLRERHEDIRPLVDHYNDEYSRAHRMPRIAFSDAAWERLLTYEWPGNIRQLRNVLEQLVVRGLAAEIGLGDLPRDIRPTDARRTSDGRDHASPTLNSEDDDALIRMIERGESFWSAAYGPFMSRDLTRAQLRALVERSLEQSAGNYRQVVRLLNMPDKDYKRFLSFLRKHDCQPSFRSYRRTAVPLPARPHGDGDAAPVDDCPYAIGA